MTATTFRSAMDVPCDVVTGFLGSGKTTMLRHVLEHGLDGRRVAVLMNEIGDIGIDGRTVGVLEGVGSMIELNSGCVCCSIDVSEFSSAYQEVVRSVAPDLVVIETTGLAHPEPILDRLEGVAANCDAVITVVDASNFIACAGREPALDAQVRAADFIVLNKTDLVSAAQIEALDHRLGDINRRAARLRTEHGRVPLDLLFAVGAARVGAGRPAAGPAPAHGRDHHRDHGHGPGELRSFSYRESSPVDTDRFFAVIAALPGEILRAKGIVLAPGGTPMLFNFVCGRLGVEPAPALRDETEESRAVFIGYGVDRLREPITARLRECLRAP